MGFGTGFDDPPRVGGLFFEEFLAAVTDPASPRLVPFTITREMIESGQVEVRTPSDAPDRVVLSDLRTVADKTQHARTLVTPRPTPGSSLLHAERSLVGDARDLLCDVLEQALQVRSVTALRCTRDVAGDIPDFGVGVQLVIHVGDTLFALEILAESIAQTQGVALQTTWDGRPRSLDGDGYVWLCLQEPAGDGYVAGVPVSPGSGAAPHVDDTQSGQPIPEKPFGGLRIPVLGSRVHLILVGGSPYGTYFGVARFLHQYLHARWVFPGDRGSVIPLAPGGVTTEKIHRIEEPALRSRTYALFTDGGSNGHEAWERDEMRSWMLRNRVHPSFLRGEILQLLGVGIPGYPTAPQCDAASDPDRQAFFVSMLRTEERVPAAHALAEYLSPQLPSTVVPGAITTFRPTPPRLDGGNATTDVDVPRYDGESMLSVYPDLRARGFMTTEARLAPGLGNLDDRERFHDAENPATCGGRYAVAPMRGARIPVFVKERPDFSAVLLDATPYDGASRRYRRFVPSCTPLRIDGPMWPFSGWQPCIFEDDGVGRAGRLFNVHPMLSADLASQILISALVPRTNHGFGTESSFSIAPNDGDAWCNCHACTHADEIGGANGSLLVLLGNIITTYRYSLELDARGSTPPSMLPWSPTDPLRSSSLSADELCMRGVMYNGGYSSQRSRRVIALCSEVTRLLLTQFDADPLSGFPVNAAGRNDFLQGTVLSTLGYNQFATPPIFSGATVSGRITPIAALGEKLPPPTLVYVTDSRDTAEYHTPYPDVPVGTVVGAADRMQRWPQQFNHERWAVACERTGLYEYIEGHQFAVPRIYTDKLQRAIVQGIGRFNLRAFVSETNAATGVTGPMLWELAQILWDPQVDVSEQRLDFCSKSFGLAGNWMKRFFDLAEQTWHSTRSEEVRYYSDSPMGAGVAHPYPDRRSKGDAGNGYLGQGYASRAAVLSQFAGLYRDVEVADGTRVPALDELWRLLEAAQRAEPATSEAGRRVQMFRRAFGFTRMIAQWYHPLHRAFEIIRAGTRNRNDIMNNLVNAASLTYDDGGNALIEPRSDVLVVPLGDPELITAVRSRIGLPYSVATPGNVPGIFSLRMRVHQYLTQENLQPTVDDQNWALPIPSGGDLGFAVLSPSGSTEGAVLLDNRMDAAARQVGIYLPEWKKYAAWWNAPGVRGRNDVFGRAAYLGSTTRGGLALEASLKSDYDSLQWILSQVGLMARAVVLYGGGVSDELSYRKAQLLSAIFQG